MNLDTVKMFFQNEKNKLIGVGVVTCLITTAIVAPISYFGGQPKYKGVIKPVSFDTMTSTGEHLADYGNLDVADDQYGWGNEDNISYVIYDEPLTRSVLEIKNAIGFQALNVANRQAQNITSDPNYELNVLSAQFNDVGGEEGKTDYVDPTNQEQVENYQLVAPINIYMRVPAPVSIFFKENLMTAETNKEKNTIWDSEWTKESSAGVYNEQNNPNNLNNRDALSSYYDWAIDKSYIADLVMAYTFFNWMLLDMASNSDVASYPNAPENANNPSTDISINEFANNVDQMLINVTTLLSSDKESIKITEDIYNQANMIQIAGTGTADPYTHAELVTFNDFLENDKFLDEKDSIENPYYHDEDIEELAIINNVDGGTDVSIQLTDEGSSTAWYMPKDAITLDTNKASDEGDWSLETESIGLYTPPGSAFLATQSRRSHYGANDKNISGMSNWGYGYQSTKNSDDEWNYMEQPDISKMSDDETKNEVLFGNQVVGAEDIYENEVPWNYEEEILDTKMALPLGFTATSDLLVFFTDNDTTFKSNGKTMKPTGITSYATKLIFQNPLQQDNITWDVLFSAGLIEATEVN